MSRHNFWNKAGFNKEDFVGIVTLHLCTFAMDLMGNKGESDMKMNKEWMKMNKKWMKMDENEWKWMKMNENK